MSNYEDMLAVKRALRKDIKRALSQISPPLRVTYGEQLQQSLLKSDVYKRATSVAVYISMPEEVPTGEILADLLQSESRKKCYVPLVQGENMMMLRVYSMDDLNSFALNSMNIPEPTLTASTPHGDVAREDGLILSSTDLILEIKIFILNL
eukprot:TRINITY_DN1884_c0_g1_i3.p1 TRINITY_DN1884_c0_g1~~TRINITY_DN1884_c0_g1_i3.p1  ORF type:complete len:151 (+),score=28.25 TRINITY_DN1884_c0_g1_i3:162-614(+)